MKSERLKKLELELRDLEEWLKLGLVPSKDIERHKGEIDSLRKKVEEEKGRLRALKEYGEEEPPPIKRNVQGRASYQEMQTMPGIGLESAQMTEIDFETEIYDTESNTVVEEETGEEGEREFEEEEDPFSDKNRWRRGILEDPDSDAW